MISKNEVMCGFAHRILRMFHAEDITDCLSIHRRDRSNCLNFAHSKEKNICARWYDDENSDRIIITGRFSIKDIQMMSEIADDIRIGEVLIKPKMDTVMELVEEACKEKTECVEDTKDANAR